MSNDNLHALHIIYRGREQITYLHFEGRAAAEEAARQGPGADGILRIEDHRGRILFAPAADVMGRLVTSVDREYDSAVDLEFRKAQANARLNNRAQADPAISFARAQATSKLIT